MTKRARAERNPWLVLRRSGIHGRGVYARVAIPAETRLIEYTGERISGAEADRRADRESDTDHHTFLFVLDDDVVIDARRGGNMARYINHSCDPNCEARHVARHIWIYSVRDIRAADEVSYDYEYDFEPGSTVEDLERYPCHCGSRNCRGTLVDVPKDQWHLVRELWRRRQRKSA